jgi:hypothetical protein
VNVNAAALPSGTSLGQIRLQAGGVLREISVRVTVGSVGGGAAVGGVSVSTDSFAFVHRDGSEEPPAAQSFRLNNSTGGQVSWTSRSDAAWLQLNPNSGYLSAAGTNVALVVNPSGLLPGSYTANVTIQVQGVTGALRLTVRLTVTGPGGL